MRSIRGVIAVVALVIVPSVPALAQSQVKGTVVDTQKQPVADATVIFDAVDVKRKLETKTDKKGEFLQIGLPSGVYNVTASKEGVGTQTVQGRVTLQGPNQIDFTLGAPAAAAAAPTSESVPDEKLRATATEAIAAVRAGRDDEAIEKFNEVVAKAPKCGDCYYNLGVAYANKKDWANAETSFKKAAELKPESPDPYRGLVTVYNTQKKFDLAAEANTKVTQLTAGAGGAAASGGGAAESYNQGVVLFNSGKFADARTQFEAATKADATFAPAFYQLGMTQLNLGKIPEAVAALETYLKLDPNGPRAAEVKASLPALQKMAQKK